MDDKFIQELRDTHPEDKRRPELLIQGMKDTLQERKELNVFKRWLWRQRNKRKLTDRFKR
ncbi:hypothetical protein Q5741_15355 [Paenibacillus sp. JX-17]|uniref:Uncharacterized protein n=1 Tax=Paenibacillus lacisoli TaxID=3064525 RepID=A0ABT9CEU5_9BACL|nr:hypothetical protein [Paenibacillus sp. JX-17]MDO7907788.1 hypothetical protein [Paenibacillus sp. JX-17]